MAYTAAAAAVAAPAGAAAAVAAPSGAAAFSALCCQQKPKLPPENSGKCMHALPFQPFRTGAPLHCVGDRQSTQQAKAVLGFVIRKGGL